MGVDCGATNLRIGIFDEKGKLLKKVQTPSPLKSQPGQFARIVQDQLLILASQGQTLQVQAMGVGTPGPLDLEKGLIFSSANLGNQEPIDLKTQFETEFTTKICFDRDTNLALLGEVWSCSAEALREVVMLTLGSGVGGAIMMEGEIRRGFSGKAGEIGHMFLEIRNLKLESRKCGLGHEGCFEALINSAQTVDEFGTYLGFGLANIVDIFNPQKIILGGGKAIYGLSRSIRVDFLPKAIEVMKQAGLKPAVDEVTVSYAKLGEWSGVYGGAVLAMRTTVNQ